MNIIKNISLTTRGSANGKVQNTWGLWLVAGAVIIIVLAWYLWRGSVPYGPGTAHYDEQTEMLSQQSSSDELTAIEADVNATDLEGLEAELSAIESQL